MGSKSRLFTSISTNLISFLWHCCCCCCCFIFLCFLFYYCCCCCAFKRKRERKSNQIKLNFQHSKTLATNPGRHAHNRQQAKRDALYHSFIPSLSLSLFLSISLFFFIGGPQTYCNIEWIGE